MADGGPYVSTISTPEYTRGITDALEVIKERWRYWDSAVVAGIPDAAIARHETWRCHEIISGRFDLPDWTPVPRSPP